MKKLYNSPIVFIDELYKPKSSYMTESDYSNVLDNIVIACVDIAIVCGEEMLLGKRKYHPQKDWWVIGGRFIAGETPYMAANRHIFNTVKLQIDKTDDLEYIMSFYGAWSLRAHKPENNGTHTHSSVYCLRITEQKKSHIKMSSEFSEIKWVKLSEVNNHEYHFIIKELAETILFNKLATGDS